MLFACMCLLQVSTAKAEVSNLKRLKARYKVQLLMVRMAQQAHLYSVV